MARWPWRGRPESRGPSSARRLQCFAAESMEPRLLLAVPAPTPAMSLAWSADYNGPGGAFDTPYAIAVDAGHNVVVAGTEGQLRAADFGTVKYDAGGNKLWTARFDGGAYDSATAVAVDAAGSVYVTGTSRLTDDSFSAIVTIKYDGDGNQLWMSRFEGHPWADAAAVAVDPAGNVVVGGNVYSTESRNDFVVIQYDPQGTRRWATPFDSGRDDYASALALDAQGNACLVGSIYDDGPVGFAVIKYSADGRRLWARGDGSGGAARAIAVGTGGDIYVAGSSLAASLDFATVKYDAAGNQQWVRLYDGPGSQFDVASAVALDAAGNVYVSGSTNAGSPDRGVATLKYSADGELLWDRQRPGSSGPLMAVDDAGNAYVTSIGVGFSTVRYDPGGNLSWVVNQDGRPEEQPGGAIGIDSLGNAYITRRSIRNFFTFKYDPAGNRQWAAHHDGVEGGDDAPNAVAVDSHGNVYVTGDSESAVGSAAETVKYTADGTFSWAARDNRVAGAGYDVTVDAAGNVYVAGTSWGDDSDMFTAKYGPQGNLLWSATYDPGAGNAYYVTVDAGGYVYVTGNVATGPDWWRFGYATIKYDPAGNQLWVAREEGPFFSGPSRPVVDAAGNVYIVGESALIKYDASGRQAWTSGFPAQWNRDIATDAAGFVYATGGNDLETTAKFDASGKELWRRSTLSGYAGSVAVLPGGDIVVAAAVTEGPGLDEQTWYETVRYGSDGQKRWSVQSGSVPGVNYLVVAAVDPAGNICVMGGSGVVKYDGDGNELWSNRAVMQGGMPRDFALDPDGNLIAAGLFWGTKGNNYRVRKLVGRGGKVPAVTDRRAFTRTDDGSHVLPTDKRALLPGSAASSANITVHGRGIDGIIISIADLHASFSTADVEVETGNSVGPWTPVPGVSVFTAWDNDGVGAAVVVNLPAGAALNTWLRITARSSKKTGLTRADVFYFGNLAGDTTNDRGTPRVDALDLAATRRALGRTDASSRSRFDFDRNLTIDGWDLLIVRNNQRRSLPLFTAAAASASRRAAFTDPPLPATSSRPTAHPPRRGILELAQDRERG